MVLFGETSWDHMIQSGPYIDLAKTVGVPTLLALIVLTQLAPKIDRGIEIADHVDAELQFLAAQGCAPNQTKVPSAIRLKSVSESPA